MMFVLVSIVLVAAVVILACRQNTGSEPGWNGSLPEVNEQRIAKLDKYPGTYAFNIVGESHYQDQLGSICGGKSAEGVDLESPALLVPYRNESDPQAIAVLMGESVIVGHLSRDDARKLRTAMKATGLAGCQLKVPAKIVGGWVRRSRSEGHFGVKLDLPFSSDRGA